MKPKPKEYAKELVYKLKNYSPTTDYDFEIRNAKNYNHNAKQCALITVDEVLKFIENNNEISNKEYFIKANYFEQVKKEIEKL